MSAPPEPDLTATKVEVTQYVAYECGQPPGISPVDMLDVKWKLYELENGQVVWSLTALMYESLGKNMSSIIQGVKQLKARGVFWEDCIKRSQARLAELNAE